MALARKYQKIFGKNADATDLGVVGSKTEDNPQYSADVETLQSLSNWETGLRAIVTNSIAPYLQDHNSIFYVITSQLAYLFQAGIAEWNSQTEYVANRSVVLKSGKIYMAIANNTNVEPEVTASWDTYWKNISTWGNVAGTLSSQTDLWNYILKGGLTTTCDTAKTTSIKDITLSDIPAPTITYLPVGTKIKVKFTNGSNVSLGTAALNITASNGANYSFKIAINNPSQNQYSRGRFYVRGGETVEFTMAQGSNGYVLMCDNKVCVTEDYYYTEGVFYRIWRDGWIEQGGIVNGSSAYNQSAPITFTKTMSDTNYFVSIFAKVGRIRCGSSGDHVDIGVGTTTTTGISLYFGGSDERPSKITWKVEGYIAEE